MNKNQNYYINGYKPGVVKKLSKFNFDCAIYILA